MALTKTKLQNQLKEIISEGQTQIDILLETKVITKVNAARLRREMYMRAENALYNLKDDIMQSLTEIKPMGNRK